MMSEQNVQELVEKIVKRVLQQLESDPELSQHLKKEDSPTDSTWARTCSSYREDTVPASQQETSEKDVVLAMKKLYTESDILEVAKNGEKKLVVTKKTIITPSARDAAKLEGIEIVIE